MLELKKTFTPEIDETKLLEEFRATYNEPQGGPLSNQAYTEHLLKQRNIGTNSEWDELINSHPNKCSELISDIASRLINDYVKFKRPIKLILINRIFNSAFRRLPSNTFTLQGFLKCACMSETIPWKLEATTSGRAVFVPVDLEQTCLAYAMKGFEVPTYAECLEGKVDCPAIGSKQIGKYFL